MEENKNILDKWFEFREEELETLTGEDKKHLYYFENHAEAVLNCVNEEMYKFTKKELDNLEQEILASTGHFNRKYYMAGFMDVVKNMKKKMKKVRNCLL